MDLFLDSRTLLPARLTFNVHPDNNMGLVDGREPVGSQKPFPISEVLAPAAARTSPALEPSRF